MPSEEWYQEQVDANQEVYDVVKGWITKDSGEREQYASGMVRDVTEGKTKWHLVFSGPMLERWANLMTRGAEKYDDDNWMKANSIDEYARFKASAFRHFMQWYGGDTDEDHAAAVVFNINGAEYVLENDIEFPEVPTCNVCGLIAAYHPEWQWCDDSLMLHDCPNCGGHDV